MHRRTTLAVAAALCVVALSAGCRSAGTKPGPTDSASPTSSPTTAKPTSTGTDNPANWTSTPVTVTHQVTVPPVPVVQALRSAPHTESGYDRVTFDITGPIPSYTIQYVSQVVGDASGKVISVPGQAYLVIKFNPAQGHTGAGTTTVPVGPVALNYPMLKGYAVAGDFEGVFTVALGLTHTTGFRVGELSGRVYVDVAQ